MRLTSKGNVDYQWVNFAAAVKPTLYLNENVYLLGGSGSISDPYIIGMKNTDF